MSRFLHRSTFESTALLQNFYASGFYLHSLISLFHYCERQCPITTEVLECYQIVLQSGVGTITASARVPLCTPLSPLAPASGQRLPSCFQPPLSLTGSQQSLMGSIINFMTVLHKEKEDQHHRMEQTFGAAEHKAIIFPANSWQCPALSQLGAKKQWGHPLPPHHSSCNLWLTHSSKRSPLAQHRNTTSTEN